MARRRRQERAVRRRGPLARAWRGFMTVAYLPIAAAVLALGVSPHLAWARYEVDLVAHFSAQASLATIALLAWWVIWRRWWFALVAVVALGLHGSVLLAPRAQWAGPGDGAGRGAVRVMQFNSYSRNAAADEAIDLLLSSGADIVSLMEPGYTLIQRGLREERLREAYPYYDQHVQGWHLGWQYILSRWPIRKFEDPIPERPHPDTHANRSPSIPLALVVERPGGAFGVVSIHPRSPRTGGRWVRGNELVEDTVGVVNRMLEAGLPVVLLADLNSTPSGLREQVLRRGTGLKRAKPLLRAEGTYPAYWEWPRRVAIDDAWVSDGVLITDWRTAGPAGSDHMAVIVDVLVPTGHPNTDVPEVDTYRLLGLP